MKSTSTKIKVRYSETDAMGVVYHGNYYIYFEVAREDLIKAYGMSYNDLEHNGVMMPIVETHCRYMKSAKYDDDIIVESQMIELTPIKAKISYEVKKEGEVLAKGYTLQTFVDRESFKIINLKKSKSEIWGKFNPQL